MAWLEGPGKITQGSRGRLIDLNFANEGGLETGFGVKMERIEIYEPGAIQLGNYTQLRGVEIYEFRELSLGTRGFVEHGLLFGAFGETPATFNVGTEAEVTGIEVIDVDITLGNSAYVRRASCYDRTRFVLGTQARIDDVTAFGTEGDTFIETSGPAGTVDQIVTFGCDNPGGIIRIQDADITVGHVWHTGGDSIGVNIVDTGTAAVRYLHGIGVGCLLAAADSGGVRIDTVYDIGSGGGYLNADEEWVPMPCVQITDCTDVQIGGGTFNGPWADNFASDPAILFDGVEDLILGADLRFYLAGPTMPPGPYIELLDCLDGKVHSSFIGGEQSGHGNDMVRLTGSTTGIFFTAAQFKPATGTAPTDSAIIDTSTGTNYAAGNDFGDVSLYADDPAVSGLVLDWPNDPTYGDNFTRTGS